MVDTVELPEIIVYPDPPLGKIEEGLLVKALKVFSPSTLLVGWGSSHDNTKAGPLHYLSATLLIGHGLAFRRAKSIVHCSRFARY
ncbi:hypothetical protein [Mesorhizobium sp. B2-8-9]|uniref:hypothetical protein n=1 Tax=Mesorhizobium sp. B2-8-9 TaxID=2589899 RepID=UPI00112B4286|nr:hypothetical protein [Mesorhizobium sp. B2-8-9]TPI76279.1 hypothetical protein FJ423_21665 [Mesorhizobium sp. B2-8-9]